MSESELSILAREVANLRDSRLRWASVSAWVCAVTCCIWAGVLMFRYEGLVADYREHVRQDAIKWTGTYDQSGRQISPGQLDLNVILSKLCKDTRDDVNRFLDEYAPKMPRNK